jgi:hypothetical protein
MTEQKKLNIIESILELIFDKFAKNRTFDGIFNADMSKMEKTAFFY